MDNAKRHSSSPESSPFQRAESRFLSRPQSLSTPAAELSCHLAAECFPPSFPVFHAFPRHSFVSIVSFCPAACTWLMQRALKFYIVFTGFLAFPFATPAAGAGESVFRGVCGSCVCVCVCGRSLGSRCCSAVFLFFICQFSVALLEKKKIVSKMGFGQPAQHFKSPPPLASSNLVQT